MPKREKRTTSYGSRKAHFLEENLVRMHTKQFKDMQSIDIVKNENLAKPAAFRSMKGFIPFQSFENILNEYKILKEISKKSLGT